MADTEAVLEPLKLPLKLLLTEAEAQKLLEGVLLPLLLGVTELVLLPEKEEQEEADNVLLLLPEALLLREPELLTVLELDAVAHILALWVELWLSVELPELLSEELRLPDAEPLLLTEALTDRLLLLLELSETVEDTV